MIESLQYGGWVIDWKRFERDALIKFISLYMLTSFILLAFVGLLYYLDARKDTVIDVRSEMLKVLYALRENPHLIFEHYDVKVSNIKDYIAPSFRQYEDRFELVACANPHYQNKVYVITAPLSITEGYLEDILHKIIVAYMLLFIPFFLFGYLLSRVALSPIKKAYDTLIAFNSDIIHDLKTPITTIGINAGMINGEKCKPLCRIESSIKTLEGLYLNLESYLKTGEHLKMERHDIALLINAQRDVYTSLYPKVEFRYGLTPLYLNIDKISLVRIIDNLVANAVKYSGRSPLVIIQNDSRSLYISDNGKGIVQPDKIFDRHYRESAYVTGYGLGLNIVKKLADQMNIQIEILSTTEQGTTFKLDLSNVLDE
ncbi:MAG: HAMP domain-containing histidine kinase [Sulfuricurvum sp.]|nr:HAMP domain-containing histidine kinase [Sulfuricurvum sp.]